MKNPVKAVHLPKLTTVDDHQKIRISKINNSDYSVDETAAPVHLPLIDGSPKLGEHKNEQSVDYLATVDGMSEMGNTMLMKLNAHTATPSFPSPRDTKQNKLQKKKQASTVRVVDEKATQDENL